MHGNAYAKFTSVYNDETIRTDIVRTSFFKIRNIQYKNILMNMIEVNYLSPTLPQKY